MRLLGIVFLSMFLAIAGCSSGGGHNPREVVYNAAYAVKNNDAGALASLYMSEYCSFTCKQLRVDIEDGGGKAKIYGTEFTFEDAKLPDEELILRIAAAHIVEHRDKPWVEKCLTEDIEVELIGRYVETCSAIYDKPGRSIEVVMDGSKWFIKNGL